jgi:hypothetical protein
MHSEPTERARCSNVVTAGESYQSHSANKCSYLKLKSPFNSYSLIIAITTVDLLIHISLVHLADKVSSFVDDEQCNTFTRTSTLLYSQNKSVKESHIGTHAHTQLTASRKFTQ